jgi:hypothetical protein
MISYPLPPARAAPVRDSRLASQSADRETHPRGRRKRATEAEFTKPN